MSRQYSDPTRESDLCALPDVEVFYVEAHEFDPGWSGGDTWLAELWRENDNSSDGLPGWYYWACFPGCLPDSDPIGPFASEDAAIEDMRENWCDDED